MIKTTNLVKSFGDLEALNGVNLHVKKGSIYGLLGSNGAGKTTLLKILAGIYKQDQGQALIDAEPIFENDTLKQRVIFISDTLYFFPSYTIEDMAIFYKSIYSSWDQERYASLQSVFKIDRKKKIQSLSKGMQRQVAIWLALALVPEVLILDEPLDGLDTVMRQQVKNILFQEVADRQLTIIISSHNLRELEDFCDHIGIMHNGAIIVEKELDDLKRDIHKVQVAFKEPLTINQLEQLNLLHKEERGSVWLLIVKGEKSDLMDYFKELNPILLDILPLTLEEIFIYEMEGTGYAVENIIFE
ncbi:ABC-2 type transport system ATP-binding protein [Desulfitispora alkaliphila]|uniref:ABC transporter ATP-binding protein n=1 Tax=Desulfitispora alkaliphila TaxID=622674 RepID=UPI003D23AE29